MVVQDFILLGIITSPHGVLGHVHVRTFTEDSAVFSLYSPLADVDGKDVFHVLTVSSVSANRVIISLDGIRSRNDAEKLRNTHLYVKRSCLPMLKEDEFYQGDLLGMKIVLEDNTEYGAVIAMHNFGTCDIAEVSTQNGRNVMLPFTKEIFPIINTRDKYIVICPPEILGCGSQ